MKIWSDSFKDGAKIPAPLAFCKIDAATHAAMSDNRNPHLAWSDLPENTRSLVVICHDYDVPSRGDDVNQEGKTVPADLPRVDFYHWVLVDLPANLTSIAEGEFSSGITARGKSGPDGAAFDSGIQNCARTKTVSELQGTAPEADPVYGMDGLALAGGAFSGNYGSVSCPFPDS